MPAGGTGPDPAAAAGTAPAPRTPQAPHSLVGRLAAFAAGRPRLVLALVLALAIAAHAPSIGWGFFADDYVHRLVLEGWPAGNMRPWSLYDFGALPAPDEPGWGRAATPWWVSPDWEVRFFRPLTSVSLWLDHALFGGNALGAHLVGLALFAALLFALHALWRALGLGAGAALLALIFFALEDGSAVPIGWIANRNAPLELLFEALAILALARRASLGFGRALSLSLAACLAAALSKESGVAAFGLAALYLLVERRRDPERLTRAQAWLGIGLALAGAALYLGALFAAGFGARCAFYPMPWREPLVVLGRLALVLPGSLPSLATPFSLDAAFLVPGAQIPMTAAALALGIPLALILWRALRAAPFAVFWAGWWLVTLLPQLAAPPSDRLLLAPSVASSALFALLVAGSLAPGSAAGRGRRLAAWLLFVSCTLVAGLSLVVHEIVLGEMGREARSAPLEADLGPGDGPGEDLIVLQSPSALAALAAGPTWIVERGDTGRRFWMMQLGRRGLAWKRLDERSFELESLDRPWLESPLELVYLSSADELEPQLGEIWRTARFTVEAARIEGGRLRTIRVRMDGALEDPRFRFLVWREGRWTAIAPPAIREVLVLPEVQPRFPMTP